ncbi:MAG TPA: PQQ-binding-like beta-propeller repeat protein [Candidatus Limnocylindrales bacterium]
MTARDATVAYPGALRARWRWGGSNEAAEVFALSETGGALTDLGELSGPEPDARCRAELRIDGPAGAWSVRLASTLNDDPAAVLWDEPGLLVVKYGFHSYGLDARSGELRWSHRSATPVLAVMASSRLRHVLVQAELETFAIEADGSVAWRVAHSDVVVGAELVGGRLVLESYSGVRNALDPASGRAAPGGPTGV